MKKSVFFLLFFTITLNGQNNKPTDIVKLSDGPYIFIKEKKLIEKTINKGIVQSKTLRNNSYDTIFYPEKSTFTTKKNIVALSDIHGQYDLAIELLKNNKIIDSKLNWNFGKGHLVIVGDVFDRGDKVNEILWLIYKLEIQAKNKGGHVHFILGNHEYMILQKDLRYINEKYKLSSKLMGLKYEELYNNQTILGRWLRSKSTIIKINDNVFVHGGVSKDFIIKNGVDFDILNLIMRKHIDFPKNEMKVMDFYDLYYGQKSLIWYRGYFKRYFDRYKENLTEKDISKILNLINSDHIVVGHCSHNEIVQLYNNKVFGVDSSIKKGKYGEVLFITKRGFFKGTLNGKLIKFK
tara:strand:+ start:1465 stop:2514 length:1050 start_codon:yes stop_codon:yes gene_type:complete